MHGEIEFKGDGPFFVLPETRFEIHDICPRFVLRYGLVYSRHLLHQQTDVVDAHLSLLAQLVHGFINTKSACFPRGAKQLLVFVPLHHNNISTCQTLHTHTHTQTQIRHQSKFLLIVSLNSWQRGRALITADQTPAVSWH